MIKIVSCPLSRPRGRMKNADLHTRLASRPANPIKVLTTKMSRTS